MTKYVITALATLLVVIITLLVSYDYARHGRPDALWLWRDILGIHP